MRIRRDNALLLADDARWVWAFLAAVALSLAMVSQASGRSRAKPRITDFKLAGPAAPSGIMRGPGGKMWFVEDLQYSRHFASKIGTVTPSGKFTLYDSPHSGALQALTRGPDGNVWFSESSDRNYLGKITPTGSVTEVPVSVGASGMTLGPDGNFWMTTGNKIARVTPAGTVTTFRLPRTSVPRQIVRGPDGNLWFTMITIAARAWHSIGRITPQGKIKLFRIPTFNADPAGLTAGPDHSLWFSENQGQKIGRVSTTGKFKEFRIHVPGTHPGPIVAGPDGNIWFGDSGTSTIGRLTPSSGRVVEYAIPTKGGGLYGLAVGPHRTLWYTEQVPNPNGFGLRGRIGRVRLPR